MPKVTIYHNPACSKSRQTLALLQEYNCDIQIVEYLKTPPNVEQLTDILNKLQLNPRELLRTREKDYKEKGLEQQHLSDVQLIEAMVITPKLMERPIVLCQGRAVIGRPPENVLNIIK